jgi:DNA-directed RNA polymerase specialized sigma24 family protein
MTIQNKGSVTHVLDEIRIGEHVDTAAQKLWEHAFSKLIRIARGMLRNTHRGAADEEDIALSAFQSLCDGAARGRFPHLDSRDSLWRVLYTITLRTVLAEKAYQKAEKRSAGRIVSADIEAVVDHEPGPEFAAMLVDELRFLLNVLRDDGLRQVSRLVLEGFSNQEIAKQMNCHVLTIERKRDLIRRAWERELTP